MSFDGVSDFLSGGSGRAAKFDNPGDTVKGIILSADVRQQMDPVSKVLKTYNDGNPMMQLVVNLQTDIRDPADPEDDGVRTVYIKGAKKNPQSGTGALIAALAQAGAPSIAEGGTLVVQFTGLGVATMGNPPKLWAMAYKAPVGNPQVANLLDAGAQQQAPQAYAAPLPGYQPQAPQQKPKLHRGKGPGAVIPAKRFKKPANHQPKLINRLMRLAGPDGTPPQPHRSRCVLP